MHRLSLFICTGFRFVNSLTEPSVYVIDGDLPELDYLPTEEVFEDESEPSNILINEQSQKRKRQYRDSKQRKRAQLDHYDLVSLRAADAARQANARDNEGDAETTARRSADAARKANTRENEDNEETTERRAANAMYGRYHR